jgi:hypothetical protein
VLASLIKPAAFRNAGELKVHGLILRQGSHRLVAATGLILLAAWLLWPVFFAQQLEGYSASLQAIAMMARRGDFMAQDLLYPRITEFLYYTRAGLIGLLRLIYTATGDIGDPAFRAVMIGSLAILLASCIIFARRVAGLPLWAIALALLLVPGVSECSFFFNDNLPSTAIVTAAIALIASRQSYAAYALAGTLIAAALLIRLDSVLLAPLVALVPLSRGYTLRFVVERIAPAAAAAVLILLLGWLTLGATPLDALLAAKGFVPMHDLRVVAIDAGLFFSLAGGAVMLIGAWASLRHPPAENRLPFWLLWGAYPVLLGVVTIIVSAEIRYLFPLFAPYVAVHGGRGFTALASGFRNRRPAAIAAIAAIGVSLVAPPKVYMLEGPSSMWGRLWTPFFWARWQRLMSDNMATVDRLVEEGERRDRLLIVQSHYNDEFFLKERLIQAGFTPVEASRAFPGCDGFSVYTKGRHLVVQVRTENEYRQVHTDLKRYSALMLRHALACPGVVAIDHAYLTAFGTMTRLHVYETLHPQLWQPIMDRLPPETAMSEAFTSASLFNGAPWHAEAAKSGQPARLWEGKIVAVPLSAANLAALRQSADRYLARPLAGSYDSHVTLADMHATYAPRCVAPRAAAKLTLRCWPRHAE